MEAAGWLGGVCDDWDCKAGEVRQSGGALMFVCASCHYFQLKDCGPAAGACAWKLRGDILCNGSG